MPKSQTEKLLDEKIFNLTQQNEKLIRDCVSFREIECELQELKDECSDLDSKNDDLQNEIEEKDDEILKLENKLEMSEKHFIDLGELCAKKDKEIKELEIYIEKSDNSWTNLYYEKETLKYKIKLYKKSFFYKIYNFLKK